MDQFWSDKALLARMQRGWSGGKAETPCGSGSTKEWARNISFWLPTKCAELGVRILNDAGAGDLNWRREIQDILPEHIRSYDLVPRQPSVQPWDITKEVLPIADAILCRHVMIHFDPKRIVRTLDLFRESGATYLFASQYNGALAFNAQAQFNPTDLRPYLGDYLDICEDDDTSGRWVTGCKLAVWQLC